MTTVKVCVCVCVSLNITFFFGAVQSADLQLWRVSRNELELNFLKCEAHLLKCQGKYPQNDVWVEFLLFDLRKENRL